MAKIQIELDDLNRLQKENENLRIEVQELKDYVRETSERELLKKALNLSFKMMNEYMVEVFDHLGFDNKKYEKSAVILHETTDWFVQNTYFNKPRITVTLDARITKEFRTAFIYLGVIPKKVQEEKADILKLLTED